jgi:hypothetical protein
MDEAKKFEEFYRHFFFGDAREGHWLAELAVPLSVESPLEEELEHVFRYARVADCNEVFAGMYGFPLPGDLIGKPLLAFINQDDKTNIETLKAFLAPPFKLEGAETHEVARDNNPHWFLNRVEGIVEDGFLVRAWGSQREITRRKKLDLERDLLSKTLGPKGAGRSVSHCGKA